MATKARRVTRRPVEESSLARQDELVLATNKAMAFIQQNRRPLIIGSAATALIVVLTIALGSYFLSRVEDRSDLFTAAVHSSLATIEPTKEEGDEASEPVPGVVKEKEQGEEKFSSYAERGAAVAGKYSTFLEQLGSGSRMAVLAEAARSSQELDQGKNDEILMKYPGFLQRDDLPAQLRFFLLDNLAMVQANSGDLAAADKTYQEIVALQGGLYADYAAYRRGQLAEAQGKKDEARAIYLAALEKYPNGPYQDEIQKRLDLN